MAKKETISFLRESHDDALENADRLHDLVTNLRYEGKFSVGKRLREVRKIIEFFNRELLKHVELEEEVIFPFLEAHIPKLESIINLLHAEHEDFKLNLENFQFQLLALLKAKNDAERAKVIEKVREKGTYLTYLLRSHIHEENASVYQAIEQQLRQNEKKELERKIQQRTGKRPSLARG